MAMIIGSITVAGILDPGSVVRGPRCETGSEFPMRHSCLEMISVSRIPEYGSRMCVLSHRMRTRTKATGIIAAALLLGAWASNGYLRATAFVVQASGMQGYARAVASVETGKFDERVLTIPWRSGQLRARLYIPHGSSDRAMLLVPGVHAAGVDEPRLVQFARDLASVNHTVLTVELIALPT